MIIIDGFDQGTPEWFAARLGVATGSNFATIMSKGRTKGTEAVGRRNYRIRLALERLTGRCLESDYTNRAMEDGKDREPMARLCFEVATGLTVREVGFCKHDTLMCGVSPDGLIASDGGVEIKSPEHAAHLEYLALDGRPPSAYWWQCYGSMWVTDASHWWFASYNPDFPEHLQLHATKVPRDPEQIALIESGVKQFLIDVERTMEEIQRIRPLSEINALLAA